MDAYIRSDEDSLDAILPTLEPGDGGSNGDGGWRPPPRLLALAGVAVLLVMAFIAGGMVLGGGDDDDDGTAAPSGTGSTTTTTADTTSTTGLGHAAGSTTTTAGLATDSDALEVTAAGSTLTMADLAAAEQVARQLIAAAERRDCDGLFALLSTRTLTFLSQMAGEGKSGKEEMCKGITTEPIPKITISKPARPGPNGSVVVELTSSEDNDVDEIVLVRESGTWKVDLLGSPDGNRDRNSSSDTNDPDTASPAAARSVESELRQAMTAEKTIYTDDGRFTDDIAKLRDFEPNIAWRRGVLDDTHPSGIVLVAIADGGRTVCLSARSSADRLPYMIKDTDGRITYAKGSATPRTCDGSPLGPRW